MRWSPIAFLIASAALVVPIPPVGGVVPPTAAAASSVGAALVPVEPCRLLDTREQGDAPLPGADLEVQVTSRCSVPPDATSASITLTSVSAARDGWLAVHPAGSAWPGTSTLNVAAGEVRANTTVVSLGRTGALNVLVDAGGHVLVDVTAAFVPAAEASSGRYVPVPERRMTDTRETGRPDPATSVTVPLPPGVPDDATALAVNLTTTDSSGPGYFSMSATGAGSGEVSVLNTDGVGQTRAAAAIVPVSGAGLEVFTSEGDHVIVDVTGYFTGSSAPVAVDGLFRSVTPRRVIDTRADGPRLFRDGGREWTVATASAGPVAAVVANITMTDVRSDGWVVMHPSRTDRPEISSVNSGVGETVANQSVVSLSTAGVTVHSASSAHVVVDVMGWFLGEPLVATGSPPTNDRSAPGRTLIIGDSIPAALNGVPEARAEFDAFDHVFDAIECRRTADTSCRYRGAPPPPTAVEVIQSSTDQFDTLVMISGYNDSYLGFAAAIDQVMEAAHRSGIDRVVWLTVREDRENLVRNNRHLQAGLDRHPDLRLVDWSGHAAGQQEWFARDNVHLSRLGAVALARFVVESVPPLG